MISTDGPPKEKHKPNVHRVNDKVTPFVNVPGVLILARPAVFVWAIHQVAALVA